MSFDPITLALAKNYTDEKVGNGGGSGGGLPVVELEMAISTETPDGIFTQADSEKLTAAFETGAPVAFKFTVNGVEFGYTFARMESEIDGQAFMTVLLTPGTFALAVLMFVRTSETQWMLMMSNIVTP